MTKQSVWQHLDIPCLSAVAQLAPSLLLASHANLHTSMFDMVVLYSTWLYCIHIVYGSICNSYTYNLYVNHMSTSKHHELYMVLKWHDKATLWLQHSLCQAAGCVALCTACTVDGRWSNCCQRQDLSPCEALRQAHRVAGLTSMQQLRHLAAMWLRKSGEVWVSKGRIEGLDFRACSVHCWDHGN